MENKLVKVKVKGEGGVEGEVWRCCDQEEEAFSTFLNTFTFTHFRRHYLAKTYWAYGNMESRSSKHRRWWSNIVENSDDSGDSDSEALCSPNWPVTQSKASQSGGDRQQNNEKCAVWKSEKSGEVMKKQKK